MKIIISVVLLMSSFSSFAENCNIKISVRDRESFNLETIDLPFLFGQRGYTMNHDQKAHYSLKLGPIFYFNTRESKFITATGFSASFENLVTLTNISYKTNENHLTLTGYEKRSRNRLYKKVIYRLLKEIPDCI